MASDPMTFSTLQQQTSYSGSDSIHDLTPVGTDEDEYKRYQQQYGQELTDDDDADLREYLLP